jgi:GDP-4-dehydro-6-deoxy-D-mannose reductase
LTVRRVLVTGSAGFIGSALVPRLKAGGLDVLELDLKGGDDVTDWDCLSGREDLEAVIHLAGRTPGRPSASDPEGLLREHFLGTLNVLELCRLRRARGVLASSNVYGEPRSVPTAEDHPLAPADPYTLGKALGEELGRAYARDFGLTVLALRFFNVYGPGQGPGFLVPTILGQIPSGRIVLRGNPWSRRDFVHVSDVAEALALSLEARVSGFEAVNVGSGTSHSVQEVVEMAARISGRRVEVEYQGADAAAVTRTEAAIGKARRVLNWSPRVALEEGLRGLIERERPS